MPQRRVENHNAVRPWGGAAFSFATAESSSLLVLRSVRTCGETVSIEKTDSS